MSYRINEDKELVRKVIDGGGYGEYSNWCFLKDDGYYVSRCYCCPDKKYDSFDELWDNMMSYPDFLSDKNGNQLI